MMRCHSLVKSTNRQYSPNSIQMNQPTDFTGAKGNAKGADKSDSTATIGASIKITGDLSGKEDLLINGKVEGTIDFRENNIVIGEKGSVSANVIAKNIRVEGEIKGELRGSDQVTVQPSGRVTGDIRAPRVILHDGCQFKGSVDMEEKPSTASEPRGATAKLAGIKPLGKPPLPKL